MAGLDDVRERIREGVAAHGWSAVLHTVRDCIARDAELAADEGPSDWSERLTATGVTITAAIKRLTFPGGAGVMAAAREIIDTGYAETRGIYTRDGLAERIAAVIAQAEPTSGAADDERPDWIASDRTPDRPGWYWAWDGIPKNEPVIVRVNRDELGNWSWSFGQWFGQYASMSRRYPWRWSFPIIRTDRC